MELYKSGNPTLTQKMFDRSKQIEANMQGTMSVRGAINKFGFLLLMVIAGAAYTWNLFENGQPNTMYGWMIGGMIGGLITAIAITFKPNWAAYLAPLYGLFEGLFIGGISVVINAQFAKAYPGLIMQAVGLTFGVAIAMFILYNFRIIKATEKFKSVVISATLGIAVFYLISMVLRMFGVSMPFFYDSSALSIGISLFVVAIAALNLILDFDMIEQGAERGAPKFMEWYGAFGLLVTMVWLYLEIVRLLSKLANNK
ncbi:Bax inhibitor-1/YccA family protein [Sediminibacterium roseum]|uniref:Bax inhibitor-1/YccA family protein n=1 Tax=Sediminibacterium roseum TaxID=1978412 RepID=A0ABW9ZNM0_9BACT|nr:Bax inhibitor-1/YccA family protein [Sediminibacterium roseum]NCI48674.1 Bax inhibitor-1/YccA family protein [Sediminibacterium roseum]